ncbi:nucleoside 2-deoxyribosyltransferase [Chamaesiphon minutus]|uniref:Nucleoside 2-deoxyribosyltransferase n=1 Tax=Chamaesiphon minutus (strain ATCC 27169 / PCC 6605) TaxID=1173020 RepID=K9UNY1_CHAP6|nr:nucleoside 2-deoxyribosyltransferase [Chamaesiphon minutus]AFY96151.1 nucleoside 2-deoxyribosyltransferase [Chamaesiphon minutus PCC 6605]
MQQTKMITKQHIYLAAPLFTKGERDFNLSVYEYLTTNGYQVFLPQQECEQAEGEDIYKTCLYGLRSAAVVVAIVDGADADSGTCWECGYAVSQGIPVIAVRTDFRGSGDTQGFNAMIYYSATKVIDGSDRFLEEILSELQVLVV